MSQNPRRPQLNLIPTVVDHIDDGFRDPRLDEGKIFTDEQGRKLVMTGGQLRPMPRPGGEVAEMMQVELFDKIAEVLIDRVIQGGQVAERLRGVIRNQIDAQYADAWFGRVKAGLAKWQYDTGVYRPQRQDFQAAMTEMMTGLSASQNAMIATLMGACVEQNRRTFFDPFEMSDHLRDWRRYIEETSFEDDRTQRPVDIANNHQLTIKRMDNDVALEMARLEAQTRAEERADAAREAEREREMEMQRLTIGMTKDLTDAMAELRLIEQQQPGVQLEVAMATLRNAMDSLAVWGASLDKETQKRMAPSIMNMVFKAIDNAQRAARRG